MSLVGVFFVLLCVSVVLRKDLSSDEAFLLQGPPFRTHHSVGFGGILIWLSSTFTISIGAGVVPSMVYFCWRMQQTDDATQAL